MKMLHSLSKKSQKPQLNRAWAAIVLVAAGLTATSIWAAEPTIPYVVRSSDKLIKFSKEVLVSPESWAEVAKLNELKDPNMIRPGQTLNIPVRLMKKISTPGKVISVQGEVQVGGVAAQPGAAVPEGAKLQTGANSSALVQLADGSRVQLMPNSLADVVSQHGYAMRDASKSGSTTWFSGAIRLVQGVVETIASKTPYRISPLEVSTPTSLVGVRGTEFRVAYEDPATGIARAEIIEGKVRTENTKQNTGVEMVGGFGAAIDPNQREIKPVALLPALRDDQLPAEVQRAFVAPRAAHWDLGTLPGASGYRAQIASDAQFNKLQSDFKSASPSFDLSSLPSGKWYARVRGVDAQGIEGVNAVKLIEIKDGPAPKLSWPNQIGVGVLATYTPEGAQLKVNLGNPDTPKEVTLQVADDEKFTKGVRTVIVQADATALVTNLTPGARSYVRFSGVSPQGVPGTSGVFALDIPGNWGVTVLGLGGALLPVH
jgi:hypothetical protein